MQAVKKQPKSLPQINTKDIALECVFKNLGICIADYYALRNAARAARRSITLTPGQESAILAKIGQLQTQKNELLQKSDFQGVKKLIALESRIINRTGDVKEIPFGEKPEALIFIIAKLVAREIKEIRESNPALYKDYTEGVEKGYWLTTYTSSLCTQLNRNEIGFEVANLKGKAKRENKKFSGLTGSFRGEKGYYAALVDTGFVIEKEVTGNKVRLKINLEWLFGFDVNILSNLPQSAPPDSPFLSEGSGLSTGLSLISNQRLLKLTEYNESGAERLSDSLSAAFPQAVDATIVAKNEKVEGEQEVNPVLSATSSQKGEKVEIPAAPGADNSTSIALECAKQCAQNALKSLFNAENLQNNRIQYNVNSICGKITPQDIRDMPFWMLEAMQTIKKEEQHWVEVAALVNEAIENTAQYLDKHPTRRIYHPLFWLNPDFSGGTLTHYINTFLLERTIKPSNTTHTPQILWMLEHGADRYKLMHYVRKHGETLVSDAIAYAGVRRARGIEPKNGPVAYIFAILRNLNPATIQFQLELEKAKLKGAKNPKNNPEKWTISRVHKLINTIKLSDIDASRLTPSVCEAIAAEAQAKQSANAQVEAWIEAVAKGKSNKFTK